MKEITQMYAKPVNDLYCRAQQRPFFTTQDKERMRGRETPAVIPTFTTIYILLCHGQQWGAIKHDGICFLK